MQRTAGADYLKAIYTENKAQIDEIVALTGSDTATLTQLKAAYAKSRPLYEQIEVLAPAFPDEDCNIDCRPDGFEFGTHPRSFPPYLRTVSWHQLYSVASRLLLADARPLD